MAKYHIGKDGVQRVCYAKSKPCPLGATSEHYESLEKATEVADKLNEILSKPDSYGMAKVGGTQVVDKNTEVAVLRLCFVTQCSYPFLDFAFTLFLRSIILPISFSLFMILSLISSSV